MVNRRKGMILKNIFFKNEREYQELKNSVLNHDDEIAINLIFQIIQRGDL